MELALTMNATLKKTVFISCLCVLSFMGLYGCEQATIEYQDDWMDSPLTKDISLDNPSYLLSTAIPFPTEEDLETPVIICAHGFSASTFEWAELKQYVERKKATWQREDKSLAYTSLVLLGGHGRDIKSFTSSTWKEWGKPILDEYYILKGMGYKNVSIATSSTAGPLLLEHLASRQFDIVEPPNTIFFIDPIVLATDPYLSLVSIIGPILGHLPPQPNETTAKLKHWYSNIPYQPLEQLFTLLEHVRAELETDGIVLPQGTRAILYKSDKDTVADPISALLIYKGLRTYDGKPIELKMIDSDLHVFTQLHARKSVTEEQIARQTNTFEEIIIKITEENMTE